MMIIILLIKIIDMLRIEMKQNINVLLKIIKENGIEHQKDPEIFLYIQMICRMSTKVLKSTAQKENKK